MAKGIIYCCIPGCISSRDSSLVNSAELQKDKEAITFHQFPKNPDRHALWIETCFGPNYTEEWTSIVSGKKKPYICSKHFLPDDFVQTFVYGDLIQNPTKKYLKITSIPSVDLPFSHTKFIDNGEENIDIKIEQNPSYTVHRSDLKERPKKRKIEIVDSNYLSIKKRESISENLSSITKSQSLGDKSQSIKKSESITEKLRQLREEGKKRISQLIEENEEIFKCPIHEVKGIDCSTVNCVLGKSKNKLSFDQRGSSFNSTFDSNLYEEEVISLLEAEHYESDDSKLSVKQISEKYPKDVPKYIDKIKILQIQNDGTVVVKLIRSTTVNRQISDAKPTHLTLNSSQFLQLLANSTKENFLLKTGDFNNGLKFKDLKERDCCAAHGDLYCDHCTDATLIAQIKKHQPFIELLDSSQSSLFETLFLNGEGGKLMRLQSAVPDDPVVAVNPSKDCGNKDHYLSAGKTLSSKLEKLKKIDQLINENNILISSFEIKAIRKSGVGKEQCVTNSSHSNKENSNSNLIEIPPLVLIASSKSSDFYDATRRANDPNSMSSLIDKLLKRVKELEEENESLRKFKDENAHLKVIIWQLKTQLGVEIYTENSRAQEGKYNKVIIKKVCSGTVKEKAKSFGKRSRVSKIRPIHREKQRKKYGETTSKRLRTKKINEIESSEQPLVGKQLTDFFEEQKQLAEFIEQQNEPSDEQAEYTFVQSITSNGLTEVRVVRNENYTKPKGNEELNIETNLNDVQSKEDQDFGETIDFKSDQNGDEHNILTSDETKEIDSNQRETIGSICKDQIVTKDFEHSQHKSSNPADESIKRHCIQDNKGEQLNIIKINTENEINKSSCKFLRIPYQSLDKEDRKMIEKSNTESIGKNARILETLARATRKTTTVENITGNIDLSPKAIPKETSSVGKVARISERKIKDRDDSETDSCDEIEDHEIEDDETINILSKKWM